MLMPDIDMKSQSPFLVRDDVGAASCADDWQTLREDPLASEGVPSNASYLSGVSTFESSNRQPVLCNDASTITGPIRGQSTRRQLHQRAGGVAALIVTSECLGWPMRDIHMPEQRPCSAQRQRLAPCRDICDAPGSVRRGACMAGGR